MHQRTPLYLLFTSAVIGTAVLLLGLTTSVAKAFTLWNPDRTHIAYSTDDPGKKRVFVTNTNMGHSVDVGEFEAYNVTGKWSPDGSKLLIQGESPNGVRLSWTVNKDGSNLTAITDQTRMVIDFDWSPDGKKLVYNVMNKHPQYGVLLGCALVTSDPDGGNKQQVTTHSEDVWDQNPTWSPDGKEIVYFSESQLADSVPRQQPYKQYKNIYRAPEIRGGRRQIRIVNLDNPSGVPSYRAIKEFTPRLRVPSFENPKPRTNKETWDYSSNDEKTGGGIKETSQLETDSKMLEIHSQVGVYPPVSPNFIWSPDQTMISFDTSDNNVYTMDSDGGNLQHVLNGHFIIHQEWSPDSSRLMVQEGLGGDQNIWVLDTKSKKLNQIGGTDNYGAVTWATDSKTIMAAKITPGSIVQLRKRAISVKNEVPDTHNHNTTFATDRH